MASMRGSGEPADQKSGDRRTELVLVGGGAYLEVVVTGDAPDVVLIPSAQRGATDFDRLARDLLAAGHASVAINPRGAGASAAVERPATLRALASDVAGVVAATVGGPAHVVGHALGNVVARATAAYHPEVVRSVTLLACGGHDLDAAPPPPELLVHFDRCHRAELPDADRLESLQVVFFSPGNDPSSWLSGWWPDSDVREIFETTNPAEWWTAGRADVLVVWPADDVLCPASVVRQLVAALGGRARLVEVSACGHAILPEQPDVIAAQLIAFLEAQAAQPTLPA
jgi:pimeloyl-ACP methyl ester carboxylesterase